MSRSLRLSDALFDTASTMGAALSRSAAQQVEHWARLGYALESRGLSIDDALRLLSKEQIASEEEMWRDKRVRQARDRERERNGKARFGDTHWISTEEARQAKVLGEPY